MQKKLTWTDYLEVIWFAFLILSIYMVLTSPKPETCPSADSTSLSIIVAATCMYGQTGLIVFGVFIILSILALIFIFSKPKIKPKKSKK